MTKEPFIQPRFVGQRFAEHTLPVSAARDLAAYEELVLELAKHLFRQKQQNRVRVPKGFVSDFSLHIEKIEEGSAKPALVAMLAGAQLFSSLPQEIIEAKDLINRVISTDIDAPLPVEFPREFYSYFNKIGRSLKEGEGIEWVPDSAENKAVLSPAKRIRLARANRETYEAESEIIGLVKELDAQKKTGILQTPGNESVPFAYDDPFFPDLKEALGDAVLYARIKGVGIFDVNDKLTSISEIEQLDCLPHLPLVSRIGALGRLADGWLEGGGIAPKEKDLLVLCNAISQSFPTSLEYPSVAPTEEGNVVLEWMRPHARIELEVNFQDPKLELYATNLTTGSFDEKDFTAEAWDQAFKHVATLLHT